MACMKLAISNQDSCLVFISVTDHGRYNRSLQNIHVNPSCSLHLSCRCERHLFTTVVFGPYLSPGENVKLPSLYMSGTGQQEHLAPATFTDMSAME